jgi:hypothetical protein
MGDFLLIQHIQITPYSLLKIILIGKISIQMLKKKFQMTFLCQRYPRPKVRMTVYVDADHAHDLVTRRSITGILMMLNNTPIRWVSKRQKTVETSTYGSGLVASRIATELILEVRLMLRSLGVDLEGPALMLVDHICQ